MFDLSKKSTSRRIVVLPKEKTKPFKVICANVVKELGTELAAYKALGISSATFYNLMDDDYLTDKMGRTILEKRKAMKADDR